MILRSVLATLALMASPAWGLATASSLTITDAYSYESVGGSDVAAGFMTLTNASTTDCTITAVTGSVSKAIELHDHIMDGDVMQMRQIPKVVVPAGETLAFKPGGLHLMFIGLNAPLKAGDALDLMLQAGSCGTLPLHVTVKARP